MVATPRGMMTKLSIKFGIADGPPKEAVVNFVSETPVIVEWYEILVDDEPVIHQPLYFHSYGYHTICSRLSDHIDRIEM
jgi:hypothetical protein